MSLKSITYTIDNEKSRDNGKSYLITEMHVLDIDEWSIRVGSAMARGGLDVRDINLANGISTETIGGILELMNLGIQGFGNMASQETIDLLNELVDRCVQFVPSGGKPRRLDIRDANDVQDLKTLWIIRKEAFNLHTGFFAQDES